MSRVGKKPIPLPASVKINIGSSLEVQGPKGKLTVPIPGGISIEQGQGVLEIKRESDQYAALHGLTRALAANAVTGVSTGFVRELDIVGIGYRDELCHSRDRHRDVVLDIGSFLGLRLRNVVAQGPHRLELRQAL